MKKNKFKIFITAIIVILIVVLGILIFKNDPYKLSSAEKSWITNNANSILNVNVINDTNIFGKLGKGVFYDFLQDFKDEYNLKINNVIENQVSPELRKDGGDITLVDIQDNKVMVKLRGKCSGCKNSHLTLKAFVERTLRDAVDQNIEVVEV